MYNSVYNGGIPGCTEGGTLRREVSFLLRVEGGMLRREPSLLPYPSEGQYQQLLLPSRVVIPVSLLGVDIPFTRFTVGRG